MKKLLRFLVPVFFLFFLLNRTAAQNVVIGGPMQLCLGECATYQAMLIGGSGSIFVGTWYINGDSLFTGSNMVTVCADQIDGYLIQAEGTMDTPNGIFAFSTEVFVEVVSSINPTIVSTSALCPTDSLSGACEKICAFNTATYEATGVPPSNPVTWEVLGAESYTASGNSVTVDWGAPGQGLVSVSAGGGGTSDPVQLYCGQLNQYLLTTNTLGGDGFVSINGGVSPYNIVVVNPMGNVIFSQIGTTASLYTFPALESGSYEVQVAGANGITNFCQFEIVGTDQECWTSVYPTGLVQPTNADCCNGGIQLAATGGQLTYSFQWSNGVTSQSIGDLCAGTYSVTVFDNNQCFDTASFIIQCVQPTCSGEASLCVEILEEPEAAINSQPPATNGTIAICQGQTVFFDNESLNATTYIWDFGDLNTSVQFEPSHTYNTPGMYNVMLIARNQCYCSDTTFIEVYVLPADVPEINCVGTLCEGETATYSTDAVCSTYNWSISGNGVLLDGGGTGDNFITVQWLAPTGASGPEGILSLDVSGCAGSVCNLPNVVPIPIITDAVQIQGPDKVCEGSTEEYFIPNYQGTEITWSVLGTGNIMDGQGSERITVNWFGDANVGNPQRVIVEFENCYLGCGGRDTLLVNIVPSFYAAGPIEVCENSTAAYQSFNTITNALMNSNWQVLNAGGAVLWTSAGATNTANVPWNFPAGSYIVRATAANASGFCNDKYDVFVKIVAAPPAVASIGGETEICPGGTYSYFANGNPPNDFTWTITGGTPANNSGNPANVTWNATGPYSFSVIQTTTTGLGCPSAPLGLAVGQIPAFDITGDGQVCKEEVGTYSVPFFENIDYQWVISPADLGSITSGDGTESVEIQWHDSGPATVSVSICGATQTFNVNVLVLPEPFVGDFDVCQGQTVNVTTTAPFSTYFWKQEDGGQISTNASVDLAGGYFEVEVTDANGCFGDTTFQGQQHPSPYVLISTPSYFALCPGNPPVTLYSLTTTSGYDFEWFRDGNPIGGNTATLSTNLPGDYQVVATDANGCTASSNILLLVDCASAGGVCVNGVCTGLGGGIPAPGCTPLGSVDFSFSQTGDCDVVDFTDQSVNDIPGSHLWFFGDNATSSLENPSHTYPAPGFYQVIHIVEVPAAGGGSCAIGILKDVLVPAAANFSNTTACEGAPVSFNDGTAFIAGQSIAGWSWDFGDPGSGAANTSTLANPSHVFAAAGTYAVALTVTMSIGCQAMEVGNVTVHAGPTVNFLVPDQTCEQTALPFEALLSADYASLWWNFGDPSSGPGNQSEVENTFHAFPTAGNYTVTLSASNILGCTASTSEAVPVTNNTLSGNIAFSQPPPICEGDNIVLTAPPGGISWEWSNNALLNNITVFESGIYNVTLTDADGCTYSPPDAIVDVLAEPNGIIKVVEYNEFGQPVGFFESPYSICEGEDVFLIVQGSLNNNYVWSTGEPGSEISFTEEKGNLLTVGTHDFTVTVTDGTTGCTSVEGPFQIIVNPVPVVAIASVPGGFLCENNSATLSVVSPDPLLIYGWNTGEMGTSIEVIAGGTYFVQAVNQFGCKGRSNEIELNNAPDIDLIPTGCLNRCNPDTMCLPNMPLVSGYQWYLNGSPLTPPAGTQAEPIFDQSGEYTVQMTDIYGCTATSDVLTLDLYPGFGDILGNVWYDVNGNGLIDGPDTLVSGIDIILNNGAVNLDTVTSGDGTGYIFVGVGADGYTLLLDETSLPPGWLAYYVSGNVSIVGCDVEEQYDWLVSGCLASTQTLDFTACDGDGVTFNGSFVPAGTSATFTFANAAGCDSVIVVDVAALPTSSEPLLFEICENTTIDYNGTTLAPGDVQDFVFQNINGCDSTVQVTVTGLPTDAEALQITTCPGSVITYQGTPLAIGDVQDFVLLNFYGCDSTVTVSVVAGPPDVTQLVLETCDGTTVDYAGATLSPGDQEDFVLTDAVGCDSIVQVTVVGLPNVTEPLFLAACEGETIVYQGITLAAGDQVEFDFDTWQGCDSTVQVTVLTSPVDTTYLDFEVCEGETVPFNNQQLAAGETASVTLTNQYNCDSTVIASVIGLPSANFDLAADEICWNASDGSIEVLNVAGSMGPYAVSLDGQNFQPDLTFENLDSGPYTVFLQDGNDCVFEKQIDLPAIPPIVIETEDQTIVCGDVVVLSPLVFSTLPVVWSWPDGSTEATFSVSAPGYYTAQVTNDCETVERAIAVTLDPASLTSMIYMPNSFSPNGDNINDCYQGYLDPHLEVESYLLRIFDRWGNQMFESTNPDECWDGRFRGELMDVAVFAWFIEMQVRNCDGQVRGLFEEGGIHLVR